MNQLQRPLVLALLAHLLGLLLALRFALPPLPSILLFPIFLAMGEIARRRQRRRDLALDRGLLLVLFASAGLGIGAMVHWEVDRDCRVALAEGRVIRVDGALGAALRLPEADGAPPPLPLVGAEVAGIPGCRGEIRVRVPMGIGPLEAAAPVTVHGKWRTSGVLRSHGSWPIDPRFGGYVQADSIVSRNASVSRWVGLRGAADRRITRLFPNHVEMVEALLLGRREYLDPLVRERFSRAGLSHLLAISGMHVGLLSATLLLLGSVTRIARRFSVIGVIVITWTYLMVIGAPSSAVRAGTMITLALLAMLLQRPSAAGPLVAAAAFLILTVRPLAILDPGFQLSFAGVLGILFLRRPLLTSLPEVLQGRGWMKGILDGLVVGVAAFIATAPIVAHHFGIVAPVSVLAGLPAVPLMSLSVVGALVALVVHPVAPLAAEHFAASVGLLLDALDWVAEMAAQLPYGNGNVARPPWLSWSLAGLVGILGHRALSYGARRLRRILGVGMAVTTLVAWPLVPFGGAPALEMHFLDVGQGDAVAIRTPGRRWILVDTGPADSRFDAGERRVLPFLRERGARRVEALVLTHPHLDHIGGAAAILRGIPVGMIIDPGLAVGSQVYLDLLASLDGSETKWREARAGRTIELDGVRLEILWPEPEALDATEDANQISVVIRVSYGDFAAVLPGDAGAEVEEALAARYGPGLSAQVLKLGHHGSATSSSEPWLDLIGPEVAVVSSGRRNRFGHPAPGVVARVERRGIEIARTDLEGTVSFRIPAGGERGFRREP